MTTDREPVGRDWLADLRNKFADEFPAPAFSSSIITEDGTAIIVDPDVGAVSAPNRVAAEAEIRRRKGRAS
ncbi:hypothetical protein J2X76_003646 [Neorhizobium sp. 2083]|uniref:hypothetical protein n=1 Tax=Neorhizobium sp. 2083 TaxID=2817762 RepID=UPI002856933E|nr:hypothetical protein [Neorhizobium sp. 2083]MDR6818469.1 hypothetical protein [Neorhizobium sp. 2083]